MRFRRSLLMAWTLASCLLLAGLAGAASLGKMAKSPSNRLASAGAGPFVNAPARALPAPPVTATAEHPLFSSTYTGDPKRVLARSRFGNVTEADLYLWMLLRESKNKPYLPESLEKARTAAEKSNISKALRAEIDDYVFYNYGMPQFAPKTPAHATDELKQHIYALPGYQLAYLLRMVQPQICIQPQDRVKYLQEHRGEVVAPEQWRVRYIMLKSAEEAPIEQRDQVELKLQRLRKQILDEEISFEDAAKAQSEAPSAEKGGEIPPFRKGELAFEFENAAANLQPGGVSEVFIGPGGFYLLQLLEVIPGATASLSDSEQVAKVDEALKCQILKSQYTFDLEDVFKRRYMVFKHESWDYWQDDEVIAQVGGFEISKGQFREMFPAVEDDALVKQDEYMSSLLKAMLEREVMAQEVCDAGHSNDPIVSKAFKMALNMVRRDNYAEALYGKLKFGEKAVRNFWDENPELFTPLKMKRVIKVSMTPSDATADPISVHAEFARVLGLPEPEVPGSSAPATEEPSDTFEETMQTSETGVLPQGGAGAPEPAAGGRVIKQPTASDHDSHAHFHTPVYLMPKLKPSQMREVVSGYKSAEFALRYEDFGYVYIDDKPTIPKTVKQVPVGGCSPVMMQGTTATCFFIEDERGPDTPPSFDKYKTQAYATYRKVQVDQKLYDKSKSFVEDAGIEYEF
jgi:parvulin-like peptidyl-prolyl isomerase